MSRLPPASGLHSRAARRPEPGEHPPGIARAASSAVVSTSPHMPPTLLTERGVNRRVSRQFREATMAATVDERLLLDRLSDMLRLGHITLLETSRLLRALLAAQNARANRRSVAA